MTTHRLPFGAQPHSQSPDISTLDSIMVSARSFGVLNAGQYSSVNPPPIFQLVISATNKSNVESNREDLGSQESYTLTYKIYNYNDSPCFAYLEIKKDKEK